MCQCENPLNILSCVIPHSHVTLTGNRERSFHGVTASSYLDDALRVLGDFFFFKGLKILARIVTIQTVAHTGAPTGVNYVFSRVGKRLYGS